MQDPKRCHLGTITQLCRAVSSQLRHISTIRKKLVKQQYVPHMSSEHGELRPELVSWSLTSLFSTNMAIRDEVNFGPLTAGICWRVWGTPANFKGFRVFAALLHDILVVGVSHGATLNRGATYIRQGGHRVGHLPTFLVVTYSLLLMTYLWR